MKHIAALLTLATACGGEVLIDDGGTDASIDQGDEAQMDAGGDGAWWRHFDAQPFDGYALPIPGEYPPADGQPSNCVWTGAITDDGTGWCCIGSFILGPNSRCMCGGTLGCSPPDVCCVSAFDHSAVCKAVQSCPQYADQ